MAVAPAVRTAVAPDPKFGEMVVITWTLASGDTAAPVSFAEYADRSFQLEGDDGGGTTTIEGSLDGTNYKVLTDPQGNALSFTAVNIIEQISEATVWIKPVLTGGAAGSIVVTLFGKRGRF